MNKRRPEYKVLDLILNRWSSRAMSGESIDDSDLMSLFEAARWAPSSYNNQPWRFIYVKRDSSIWQDTLNLLVDANKLWAKNGAVLILAISCKYFEYNQKKCRTHSFDTGAAVENLALQGYSMGFVVHGMEGFDYDKARLFFNISDNYDIEAVFVVGKPGPLSVLPEKLQLKEVRSDRKKVEQFVFKDFFKNE